ncbi:ATP-binding cassette domain-containing protein [Rhizohabitans arisaemae]|uniref:ATP-binding cassette domain-containing protein n=1 Tax=Rhizohabitans arisaemae TaxID=2720610 RepID=UPI0024B1C5A8|nr:ABC transporter ATP-binding protein [Rhizohabitans arisaemae]
MKIEVDDLVMRYGATTALDRLSLNLEGGKIYGLLGRNGSGKTTLLSVLAAFRRPTGGRVRIDGQPVFENARLTERISLIRDGGATVELGSAQEAVGFAEWLRPGFDGRYARSLMALFGLDPKKSVSGMSKGQRAALGVVMGLASRAPLTMFDEAYLGMDAPSRYAFYDALLSDYLANPRTIILSTHHIEEVASLFEEVVIIDKGRLVVHEESTRLLSRGTAVTGPAAQVEAFTTGLTVLNSRRLGPTTAATIYGDLDEARLAQAAAAGLELGPIPMQDLFVHLTGERR